MHTPLKFPLQLEGGRNSWDFFNEFEGGDRMEVEVNKVGYVVG